MIGITVDATLLPPTQQAAPLPAGSLSRRRFLTSLVASPLLMYAMARPAAAQPTDVLTARTRFFGAANVHPDTGAIRPDRMILSWFGCTGFALALGGRVFLLNAWVPRGYHDGYVPTTPDELAALQPAAIFIGHGHFDHAADVPEIARRSGAAVIGTVQHCAQVRAAIGDAVEYVQVMDQGAGFGESVTFEPFPGLRVIAMRNLHSPGRPSEVSAPDTSDEGGPHAPVAFVPSAGNAVAHPPNAESIEHFAGRFPDAEGGSLLYRFESRGHSLVWNDTVGNAKERAPELLEAMRGLPRSDVHVGAIAGLNQFTNGMRDVRHYVEALRPRVFAPCHHDDTWPLHASTGEPYREPLAAEFTRLPEDQRPELRFIVDPHDYVRPEALTFSH